MSSKKAIPYESLRGKSAIVTGGASGLGLATATKFAENGAIVTIADANREAGEKVASELKSKDLQVSYVFCDVTDWQSLVAAFKHAVNFSPSQTLDVAALFAGIASKDGNIFDNVMSQSPSLERDPVAPTTEAIDINLTGEYWSAWLALYYFNCQPGKQSDTQDVQKSKSLVLIASLAGYIDFTTSSQYAMSKYGVRGLFRSLRKKIKDTNIRCNVICPGYTRSPMTDNMRDLDMLWAPVDAVVDAACLCATDDTVHGKLTQLEHDVSLLNEHRSGILYSCWWILRS